MAKKRNAILKVKQLKKLKKWKIKWNHIYMEIIRYECELLKNKILKNSNKIIFK